MYLTFGTSPVLLGATQHKTMPLMVNPEPDSDSDSDSDNPARSSALSKNIRTVKLPADKVYFLNNCTKKNVAIIPDQYRFRMVTADKIEVIKPLTPYLKEMKILVLVEDNKSDKDYFTENAERSFYEKNTKELHKAANAIPNLNPCDMAECGLVLYRKNTYLLDKTLEIKYTVQCGLTNFSHGFFNFKEQPSELHTACPYKKILRVYQTLPSLSRTANEWEENPSCLTTTSRYRLIIPDQYNSQEILTYCHTIRVIKENSLPLNMVSDTEWNEKLYLYYEKTLKKNGESLIQKANEQKKTVEASVNIYIDRINLALNKYETLLQRLLSNQDAHTSKIINTIKEALNFTQALKTELSEKKNTIEDILTIETHSDNQGLCLQVIPELIHEKVLTVIDDHQKSEQKKLSTINPSNNKSFSPVQLASLLLSAQHHGNANLTEFEQQFVDTHSGQLAELRSCGTTILALLAPLTIKSTETV